MATLVDAGAAENPVYRRALERLDQDRGLRDLTARDRLDFVLWYTHTHRNEHGG